MGLVDDWIAFCDGRLDADKSHFLSLFHAEHSEKTLDEIFRFFPTASSELKERMLTFMSARKARIEKRIVPVPSEELLKLAELDLRAKALIFESLGENELLRLAENNEALMTDDKIGFEAAAKSDWPNGEKQVVVSDFVLDHWFVKDAKTFALFEAFYGAANSYDIQYYLAAPLIDTDVNFDAYFGLWAAGADIALVQTSILVFKNQKLLAHN